MDPVTAIQLASAVFTFVQAGAVVLKTAREIRDSADGLSDDVRSRRVVVESMKGALTKLKDAGGSTTAGKSTLDHSLLDLVIECEDISDKIEECLRRIQKSRLGTLGSAGKALFKKNELEGLETRLDRCRGQLALELGNLRDERLKGYFENVEYLMRRDRSRLEQLFTDIKELIEGVQRGHIGNEAQGQLEGLLGIQDETLRVVYRDRILWSLRFEGMGRRYESVQQCNQKTFTWIFENEGDRLGADEGHRLGTGGEYESDACEESPPLDDDHDMERLEMKREARKKFLSWISSPTGIFHISGKLGSGKSILMKFLYNSRSTRTQVEKWAGSRKLVYANFFFWKPGSEMEKSLDGLFRSLLYDILKVFPDLTRDVLHQYWAEAERIPLQTQQYCDIPPEIVQKALEKIITDRRVNEGHCFCFFLDALDEYDDGPRHQNDQLFLVDLLQRWVETSDGSLALCVSSREDSVFMNAFPGTQRLQLHRLNLFDIRNYTRQALARFPGKKTRDHLVDIIPQRAEGIFLWAVLVIKNLRRMMPDGHIDTHELDELLDGLPSELEDLLKHIIARFTKHERKTAYQTMKLVQTADTYPLRFPLLAFSFIGEYQKDPNFVFRDEFPTSEMKSARAGDAASRYHKQLRRVCGGLVELQTGDNVSWGRIEFTHRSVPEMFGEGELKEAMESTLEGFNSVLALSHLICARVRFADNITLPNPRPYNDVVRMLLNTGVEDDSNTHLEFIDSRFKSLRRQNDDAGEIFLTTSRVGAQIMGYTNGTPSFKPGHFYSVLCLAAYLGSTNYIKWKIFNDHHALDHPLERVLATHLMLERGPDFWTWDHPIGTGLFTDVERVGFVFYTKLGACRTTTDELTIWERHLVFGFLAWEDGRFQSGGESARRFGEVCELFLQHGAANNLVIIVKGIGRETKVVLRFDHAEVTAEYTTDRGNKRLDKLRSMSPGTARDLRDVHVTLRDWIEIAELENKDRLLGLIDSGRERVLGRCDPSQVADMEPSRVEEEDKPEAGEKIAFGGKDVAVDVEVGQMSTVRKVALGLAVSVLICSVWAKLDSWKGR